VISAIINGTEECGNACHHGMESQYRVKRPRWHLVRTIWVDSTRGCPDETGRSNSTTLRAGRHCRLSLVRKQSTSSRTMAHGSNGLTSARHDVVSQRLCRPISEPYDKNVPADLVYTGQYKVTDTIPGRQSILANGAVPNADVPPILIGF